MRHKEKRRCSPADFYSVGAERGRPQDRSQACMVSKCVDKEGTACTKVVLQSRVRIWRWYVVGHAVILPGRWWCRTWTFLLVSGFCSSACCFVSLFGPLVFGGVVGFWPSPSVASRRPLGRAPCWFFLSSGSSWSSCISLWRSSSSFVWCFCLCWALVLWYDLDFGRFPHGFCISGPFSRAFSGLRGVRQVERFAECSFLDICGK